MLIKQLGMIVLLAAPGAARGQSTYYTSPEHWEKPRNFHEPFNARYEGRLALETGVEEEPVPLAFSPNGGYWLAGGSDNDWELGPDGEVRTRTDSPEASLLIHTERDTLLAVRIHDRHPNYSVSARWISEKLVFVRVYWGRVLGTDAIVDVEKAEFVYREMLRDGVTAFIQHTHLRETEPH